MSHVPESELCSRDLILRQGHVFLAGIVPFPTALYARYYFFTVFSNNVICSENRKPMPLKGVSGEKEGGSKVY